jgi:hypothetical protein
MRTSLEHPGCADIVKGFLALFAQKSPMTHILVVDNYDSFVYTLNG